MGWDILLFLFLLVLVAGMITALLATVQAVHRWLVTILLTVGVYWLGGRWLDRRFAPARKLVDDKLEEVEKLVEKDQAILAMMETRHEQMKALWTEIQQAMVLLKERTQAAKALTRVTVVIDTDQSQVSYKLGPNGLSVNLLLTIENGLDVNCLMKKLELSVEMTENPLQCSYHGFRPETALHVIREPAEICVTARAAMKGWATFIYNEGPVQMDAFRKFILTTQAIGELEQTQAFTMFDKHHASVGYSPIVLE